MYQPDDFIVRSQQKVIDHYRWLRDTARSEVERARFQRRMIEEYEALQRHTLQQASGSQRAA